LRSTLEKTPIKGKRPLGGRNGKRVTRTASEKGRVNKNSEKTIGGVSKANEMT